jgi:hypothetical protein
VRRRWLLALAATGAIWLAAPATASAATYCVHFTSGCTGTTQPTIAAALTAAAGNPGRDLIRVGPGSFSESFDVDPANNVDIVGSGAGPGGTQLNPPSTTAVATVDEPSSTVQSMALTQTSGGPTMVLSGTADGLNVTGPAGDTTAVEMNTSATLRNSTVSVDGGMAILVALGAQNVTVEDSTLSGGYGVFNAGAFTGRRLRIDARRGLDQQNGTTANLEDVLMTMTGGAALGISVTPTTSSGGSSVVASHLTIVGDGSSNQFGVSAFDGPGGENATVDLRDSILRGLTTHLSRRAINAGGRVQMNVSYSDYDFSKVIDQNSGTGTGSINSSNNLNNVDPLFVDPGAGNYRLRADSPLIDAGTPGGLGSSESQTDADRNPRLLDGNGDCGPVRDMGAFEFQPPARSPLATASAPATARAGDNVGFDASASCDPDAGDSIVSYTWVFDDGGTATGATVQHAFARRGAHSGTVTVTDTTGRTATATAVVVVSDDTNPVARSLGIKPSTIVPANSGASITAKRGATVSYGLSEPASVKFTVERAGPGRKVKGKCVKPRRSNRKRKRCTLYKAQKGNFTHPGQPGQNSFKFTGRLRGKKLKPGRYRLVAVPTDLSGNKGKAVRKTFKVKR